MIFNFQIEILNFLIIKKIVNKQKYLVDKQYFKKISTIYINFYVSKYFHLLCKKIIYNF
jgi:hypothetical protein